MLFTTAAAAGAAESRHPRSFGEDHLIASLLSETQRMHGQDFAKPLYILFVHLRTLQLAPGHADTRFQIRLRYGDSGRYQERFSPKVRSTPKGAEQCAIQSGSLVQIQNLTSTPQLNGVVGLCEGWDSGTDRWNIRVSDAEVKSVRVQNIVPAADVFATFDDLQMFRWDPELPPYVNLAIRKLGLSDSTISAQTVKVPFRDNRLGAAEQEMMMFKRTGRLSMEKMLAPERWKRTHPVDGVFVGQLGMAIELKRFTVGELSQVASGADYFHEMLGTLDLLSVADALAAAQQPVYVSTVIHPIPYSVPVTISAPSSSRNRLAGNNAETNQKLPAGCTTGVPALGCTTGVAQGMSRGSHQGMPSSSSQGMQVGECGSSPCVIGRPVPGTGWSWRGEKMKED